MVDPYWARVCGPLEPYVDGLRGELERLGYTPLSAAGHVRLVAHLSRWMIHWMLFMAGRFESNGTSSVERWWPGDIGVNTSNGRRVLRRASGGRLLQLAHGPVVAATAGLPARVGGRDSAGAGDPDDSV